MVQILKPSQATGRTIALTLSGTMNKKTPPLSQYLGVLIHSKTHKRELVNALFELGLCISYEHVMTITTILNNNLGHQFDTENVMCPPKLRKNIFINNIDHNPSSTTAKDSFYGTGISLFQHPDMNQVDHTTMMSLSDSNISNNTLGRARNPCTNGAWLNKLTE